jgi:short-subunit dehydrogenase
MAIYYASKAYVLSFTEAIAEELAGTGVTATALCPGVVPSGFQEAAGLRDDAPMVKSPGAKSAQYVARAAYDGMMHGKRVIIPGTLNKVGVQSLRLAPRRAVVTVVRRLHPPD